MTGYEDYEYAGAHAEFGAYALLVGVEAPEPIGVAVHRRFQSRRPSERDGPRRVVRKL